MSAPSKLLGEKSLTGILHILWAVHGGDFVRIVSRKHKLVSLFGKAGQMIDSIHGQTIAKNTSPFRN
jgi:hypothetical protein